MIAVGVGRNARPAELEEIAGSKQNVLNVESYEELEDIIDQLAGKVCNSKYIK